MYVYGLDLNFGLDYINCPTKYEVYAISVIEGSKMYLGANIKNNFKDQ